MKPPWYYPHYGTHLPALIDAVRMTTGPVLELGAGDWSTPVLHQICWNRLLVTVEKSPQWAKRFESMNTDKHLFVANLSDGESNWEPWSVILVDNEAPQRAIDLRRLRADIFVVHDTEPNHIGLCVGLQGAVEAFNYRKDYKEPAPWTTLVSQRIPL